MSDALRQAPLDTLLRWVQAVVVHSGGPEAALGAEETRRILDVTPESVEEVLVPSATLSALERIGVYATMYPLRMEEALAVDFPGVKHFLGCELWHRLVAAYVLAHPSRHQNLNQLGRHLPEFLRGRKELPDRMFLSELADLELAMTLVFDANESPQLGVDELAELAPEKWGGTVFRPVAALELRAFQFPVNAYLQAVKEERDTPPIRRKATYVAVYRKDWVVWRQGLSQLQYKLLKVLSEGKTVGAALTKLARSSAGEELARELRTWFSEWVEEGFFSEIRVTGGE